MFNRERHFKKISTACEFYIEDKLKSKVQKKSDRKGLHLKKREKVLDQIVRGTGHSETLLG